jgi:hypothetical protein
LIAAFAGDVEYASGLWSERMSAGRTQIDIAAIFRQSGERAISPFNRPTEQSQPPFNFALSAISAVLVVAIMMVSQS